MLICMRRSVARKNKDLFYYTLILLLIRTKKIDDDVVNTIAINAVK